MPNFTRSSIAFDEAGRQYAQDEPILRSIALRRYNPDLQFPTGEGAGGADIAVAAGTQGLIWGITANRLYTNTDGNWVQLQGPLVYKFGYSACLPLTGTLIMLANRASGQSFYEVLRCTTGGEMSICQKDNADFSYEGDGGDEIAMLNQNIEQAPHGTVIFAEYERASGGAIPRNLRIYRSTDDGATWTTVYTHERVDGTQNAHFHCVGYDPHRARWYAWMGDGTNRCILYSDDDGITWDYYTVEAQSGIQPVTAECISQDLFFHGSDSSLGAYIADYSGGVGVAPDVRELTPFSPRVGLDNRFSWLGRRYGAVYIANHRDDSVTGNNGRSVLYATDDPLAGEMTAIAPLPPNIRSMERLAGPVGGYLYGMCISTSGVVRQIKFRLPSLRRVDAVEVWPAVTNLLTADQSTNGVSAEFTKFTAGGTYTKSHASIDANHGGNLCFEFIDDEAGSHISTASFGTKSITPSAAQTYTASIRLRAPSGAVSGWISWRLFASEQTATRTYWTAGPEWMEVRLPIFTTADTTIISLLVSLAARPSTAPTSAARHIQADCLQIAQATGPRAWQLGGTPRAADLLTDSRDRTGAWTDRLDIYPLASSADLSGDHVVLRYAAGDSGFAVYWDASNSRWAMAWTVDGESQDAVVSAATWFQGGQHLAVTVSATAENVTVHLDDGSPDGVTLSTAEPIPDLLAGSTVQTIGDGDGMVQLPVAVLIREQSIRVGPGIKTIGPAHKGVLL